MTRRALPLGSGARTRPAFYAPTGTLAGDLVALLHLPYTAWHLSYVAFGAVLATEFDLGRLAGTLAAFLLGTGVAAHALDEWRTRPLRTGIQDGVLLAVAIAAIVGALAVAAVGAVVVSPWTLLWALAGVLLMAAYALEWSALVHSDLGFALAWGAFPVLAGYWAQAERIGLAAVVVAVAAVALSLAQRALSTAARFTRRRTSWAEATFRGADRNEVWARDRLLATWERPLLWMAASTVALAIGLVLART